MKRKAPLLAATLSLLAISAGILALGGCASTSQTPNKDRVLVCPQCKMVAKTVERSVSVTDVAQRSGRISKETVLDTVYTDTCPGCQGAIKTFFKEGKLQHMCSVCKETPFTCPIVHPIDKG